MSQKITLATVKSFVKKNRESLFIDVRSKFDGMIDGIRHENEGFGKAGKTEENIDYTLGVSGAWFVGRSRDYFEQFENEKFIGIKVFNSCGSFILAVEK